jgi:hypothetical protein
VPQYRISSGKSYNWKPSSGLEVSDARRLKAVENENAKFKLVGEAMLDARQHQVYQPQDAALRASPEPSVKWDKPE